MSNTISKKIDFTQGKVLKNMLFFSIPIFLATLMQMLFNAVDVAIIGRFGGSPKYQAAVGATSSSTHLIINLFMGIALSANVVMSHYVGAKDETGQERLVHTSIATALACGTIVLLLGVFFSRGLLTLIRTPAGILDYSTTYMQIYFASSPAIMVYNFGSSLLRSAGETKKPIYYLAVAGGLNVIINVVTVIFFHWHVIGVALGTTVSQYVSAIWILVDLSKGKAGKCFCWKKMRFHAKELKKLLSIGLPMGLSTCCFSLSNIFIQSSVNAYGSLAIAGNTVAVNLDTLCDSFASSIEKAIITFVGENVGAKKVERIHKITFTGLFLISSFQILFGVSMLSIGKYICMLYNPNTEVVQWAMKRVLIANVFLVTSCGMYVFGGALRGMGNSIFPMMANLTCSCLLRIAYIFLIYQNLAVKTIQSLYIVYPVTWFISSVIHALLYFVRESNIKRTHKYDSVFENRRCD